MTIRLIIIISVHITNKIYNLVHDKVKENLCIILTQDQTILRDLLILFNIVLNSSLIQIIHGSLHQIDVSSFRKIIEISLNQVDLMIVNNTIVGTNRLLYNHHENSHYHQLVKIREQINKLGEIMNIKNQRIELKM